MAANLIFSLHVSQVQQTKFLKTLTDAVFHYVGETFQILLWFAIKSLHCHFKFFSIVERWP